VDAGAIGERRGEVGGLEAFWREAPARTEAPLLYVHGVPMSSDEAVPFLDAVGGVAPDLPGFGRSAKPPNFRYSIAGYGDWLEAFVDSLGIERFSLFVHDWGAVGLELAQRRPEAVERLVVVDAVPLLPGYRWHPAARLWRTPVLGEIAMGLTTRRIARRLMREATQVGGPVWEELFEASWSHFDQGTMRAILRLYRSAPPEALAAAGTRLGELRCPALVAWGAEDQYLQPRFAHEYAAALGGEARVEIVAGAGHWPWLDRPELAATIREFLLAR
jgi:pimeloyl-ACP methyl ester carboxylesterase